VAPHLVQQALVQYPPPQDQVARLKGLLDDL